MKSVTYLFESFHPSNYRLSLAPDRENLAFHGSVTIVGQKVGRPSKRLTFHQKGLTISSATIIRHDKKGDQEFSVKRVNNQDSFHEVRLHSEATMYPGNYTITMNFSGVITRGMTGLYPCYFNHKGKEHIILATQFESHHAREVFPCIDEPEAKATFDVTLTHEKGLTVLGNMPAKQVTSGKGLRASSELTETSFETTPIMSVYLLAFVIGEFHELTAKTKSETAVSIWATAAQPKASLRFALDVAVQSIEYFEDYFKTPYPLAKADHVALPDFSSGAMENWGLITYREIALLLYPDAASQSMKELVATVVAHETSHQWFGNLVTMKWWDDLWLNESFANMMEYAAVDHMFPEWNIWESFVTREGLNALRRDATPGVQAVKSSVQHPDEISTLFDPSIVYAKGGRLLWMLKNYVGDSDFRTGLQHYFKKHAYQNTTGADLWSALSHASGKDIAAFMNPWLERSGFPVVSVSSTEIVQEHFLDSPEKSDHNRIWPVPLFANDSSLPKLLDTCALKNTTSPKEYQLILNTGGRGHYLVQYKDLAHQDALKQLVADNKLGVIDRLMLLTNSTMLARAGYDNIGNTLRLMEAYSNETNDAVWDIIAVLISDTRRFIDYDESLEPKIKSSIRNLIGKEYARLGWEESKNDSAADQRLRATIIGLGVYSDHPAISAEALRLFEAYKTDQNVVSAELRGIIFSAAIKHAVPGATDYLLELHATTSSSDLRHDAASGLTSTRNQKTAKKLLEVIKHPKLVKPQDADRWFVFLLRNHYTRETAWQWMEDNWQWVIDTYRPDKSYDNFPRYAAIVCNTPEWEAKYHAFFGPKTEETMLKRNIQIGFEEISSRIAWLQRDLSSVQKYFRK